MEQALNRPSTTCRAVRRAGWLLAALLAATAGSAAQAQTAPADVLVSGPAGQITRADLEIMVTDLVPAADRERFWLSRDAVARVARSLYTQRALAAEALKAGLENSPEGAAYLRMIRERALTELLMQQRVREATPDAAAQERFARSEYKAKPERFALPDEVHVRHILLPVARDGSDDAQVKAEAHKLVEELRRGGADFAALARAVPGTTLVLDHFGTPLGVGPYAGQRDAIFSQWQRDIEAIARCPNVVAKLGGLPEAPFVQGKIHPAPEKPLDVSPAFAVSRQKYGGSFRFFHSASSPVRPGRGRKMEKSV